MKKINLMLLISWLGFNANCFSQAVSHPGYLTTIYGKIVKDIYGGCVHSIYFNKDTDADAACPEDNNSGG